MINIKFDSIDLLLVEMMVLMVTMENIVLCVVWRQRWRAREWQIACVCVLGRYAERPHSFFSVSCRISGIIATREKLKNRVYGFRRNYVSILRILNPNNHTRTLGSAANETKRQRKISKVQLHKMGWNAFDIKTHGLIMSAKAEKKNENNLNRMAFWQWSPINSPWQK